MNFAQACTALTIILCSQYATSVLSSPSPSVLKRDEFVCVQYSEATQRHTGSLTLPPVQSTSHLDCGGDDTVVVYASLGHFTPASSSTAPRPTREEFSEYAPIRVS